MQCQNLPQALDLCRCADDDAKLWIGEPDAGATHAMLTHVATGGRIIIPLEFDSGEASVPMPTLAVGEVYMIQTVSASFAPVAFRPYQQNGTVLAPVSTAYDGVTVVIVRCANSDYSTYLGPDQWITLP